MEIEGDARRCCVLNAQRRVLPYGWIGRNLMDSYRVLNTFQSVFISLSSTGDFKGRRSWLLTLLIPSRILNIPAYLPG